VAASLGKIAAAAWLIYSVGAGFAIVEWLLLTYRKLNVGQRLSTIESQLRAFRATQDDDERQRLVLRAGVLTLAVSTALLVVFLVAIAVMALPLLWTTPGSVALASYMLLMTAAALLRWRTRAAPTRSSELSTSGPRHALSDRWLHWIALEPSLVRHISFDMERQFALPRTGRSATDFECDPSADAVYVCGLARSGTTLVLRLLDQAQVFSSLSYRDMPFPLTPNLWRRLSSLGQKKAVAAERIHGDGMLVDFDSPEGFEEVFWRTFTRYSTDSGRLSAEPPSAQALAIFADYRALVANPRGAAETRRYLSKNNNNLLRLQALANEPDATVVLVFRNPAAAALSMHRVHSSFGQAQSQDPYMRRYMRWLCHHEFGLDHRPFEFALAAMNPALEPAQLDYWLDYWCAVHEHVLKTSGPALRLLDYDAMCQQPDAALHTLFAVLRVDADEAGLAAQITRSRPTTGSGFDPALLRRANDLLSALKRRADNMFEDIAA
jgi:Sulfotransferase family